jgi:DegV family protein with EDD domain
MTVRIVTDSTCDLPPELVARYGITVVPLFVRFGQDIFRDGVDLSADEFYTRLTTSKSLPTTSAPSPGIFAETYQRLIGANDQVLSIHISGKMSGTCNSALNARDQFGSSGAIEVVDCLSVSMGLGLLALEAARAGAAGMSLSDVAGLVRKRMADEQ